MSRGMPSMTALLGMLAIAGYQNRDKLADMFRLPPVGKACAGTRSRRTRRDRRKADGVDNPQSRILLERSAICHPSTLPSSCTSVMRTSAALRPHDASASPPVEAWMTSSLHHELPDQRVILDEEYAHQPLLSV